MSESEGNASDKLDDVDYQIHESRKRKKSKRNTGPSPNKKKKDRSVNSDEGEFELKEGQEVVGVVVRAPVEGRGTFSPLLSSIHSFML
jgi:hypothetical protein